ncbi:MAG: hypothetical protein R3B47_02790 [Bacteroidia bacterium]
MLFIKYLSDVWKDKKRLYEEKYEGDNVRVQRALSNERFKVEEDCTLTISMKTATSQTW